ncbi:UNVERIFIED_CONTAM: hypothetical protein NCL1_51601 [Trichonephila clavipes]
MFYFLGYIEYDNGTKVPLSSSNGQSISSNGQGQEYYYIEYEDGSKVPVSTSSNGEGYIEYDDGTKVPISSSDGQGYIEYDDGTKVPISSNDGEGTTYERMNSYSYIHFFIIIRGGIVEF